MLAAVAVAGGYVILWVGFHPRIRFGWVSRWGDLSYGTYLYAFLIQQLLAKYLPGIRPMTMFAMATPAALAAGYLSWHLIEKPFLARARVRATEAS
jgi:peptidoglycan/LPS O-acetylase OafA/YrhL